MSIIIFFLFLFFFLFRQAGQEAPRTRLGWFARLRSLACFPTSPPNRPKRKNAAEMPLRNLPPPTLPSLYPPRQGYTKLATLGLDPAGG